MKVTITLDTDEQSIAEILRATADRIETQGLAWVTNTALRDANGDMVGELTK